MEDKVDLEESPREKEDVEAPVLDPKGASSGGKRNLESKDDDSLGAEASTSKRIRSSVEEGEEDVFDEGSLKESRGESEAVLFLEETCIEDVDVASGEMDKDPKEDQEDQKDQKETKDPEESKAETRESSNDSVMDPMSDSEEVTEIPPPSSCAELPRKVEGIQKVFKRLNRSELENLVVQKMVAYFFCESEVGALRQKCDSLEEAAERGNKKILSLQKQCQDLNTVIQRYIKDVSNSTCKERVAPVRVTRSVGLQVRMPGKETIASSALPTKKLTGNNALTVVPIVAGGGDARSRPLTATAVPSPIPSMTGNAKVAPLTNHLSNSSKKGVIDLVELSDEEDDAVSIKKSPVLAARPPKGPLLPPSNRFPPGIKGRFFPPHKHPAPLPLSHNVPSNPEWKLAPPRPTLKISRLRNGIVVSWDLGISSEHAPVLSYQLFAYHESRDPPSTALWKKVGDVNALPLPMACTLTQFLKGNKYHFAIRALDSHGRTGPFSEITSFILS